MNEIQELLPDIKLRFNIDHPSLEECYLFGYECALANMTDEENPYREGTQEYEQWQEGWWAGFYDEKPVFSSEGPEPDPIENDEQPHHFISDLVNSDVLANILKITGAIAATAVVGYQVFELVA